MNEQEVNAQISTCCDMSKADVHNELNPEFERCRSVRLERCRSVRPIDEELCNIIYERGQIGERIRKLEGAIKANPEAVSDYHKGLWKTQLDAMECYYNTLGERIKDFVDQTQRVLLQKA